ncbi:Coiled-coil domain-containing protein 85C [Trichoplax sp. H2]|nr:Coiled-coil domain-containing protein 85C [Trichoplax sp. H2]|eukprot:RDD44317.1 Coiled-coil domain-containing protein 85C [Trichoplax sp. H2]
MPGEREDVIPRSEYLRVKERLRRSESEKMGLMMDHSNLMQDMDLKCSQQLQEIQRLRQTNERLQDENEELLSLLNAQPEENGHQQNHHSNSQSNQQDSEQYANRLASQEDKIDELINENRILKEICTYLDNRHQSNLSSYPPLSQASLDLANSLDLTSIPKRHPSQDNHSPSHINYPLPTPSSSIQVSHLDPPPPSSSSSSSSQESNDSYDQTASVPTTNHAGYSPDFMNELKHRISSLKHDDDDAESVRTEKDDELPRIRTSNVKNGADDVFANPLPPLRLRKSFSNVESAPRSGILRKSTSLGSNEGYLNSRSLTPSPNLASNNSSIENIPTPVVARMNVIPRMLPKPTIVNGTSINTQASAYYANNNGNYGTDL